MKRFNENCHLFFPRLNFAAKFLIFFPFKLEKIGKWFILVLKNALRLQMDKNIKGLIYLK